MLFSDVIANRAVGQYPISIATSLAIESAFGIHPDIIVAEPPILEYPQMWINVRTLYRNLVGAVPATEQMLLTPGFVAPALAEEMDHISTIIAEQTSGKTEVFYFLSNYAGMERKYKKALLRRDTTEKQKDATHHQNASIDLLLKSKSEQIQGWDLKLRPKRTLKSLLITHYAYDLLSADQWPRLTLLETHTGALKDREKWFTKYYNGKELPEGFPFTEYFLQIFGDNQHFRPLDARLRRDIVEIAIKYNWNSVTTREKIRYGLEQLQNPWMRDIVFEMMHQSGG